MAWANLLMASLLKVCFAHVESHQCADAADQRVASGAQMMWWRQWLAGRRALYIKHIKPCIVLCAQSVPCERVHTTARRSEVSILPSARHRALRA